MMLQCIHRDIIENASASPLLAYRRQRNVFSTRVSAIQHSCCEFTDMRQLRQMLDLAPQHVAVFGPGGERLYADRIGLDYVGLGLEEWRQTPGIFFYSRWVHSS